MKKLLKGNEKQYVQLQNCGESEIVLGGTVINDKVEYIVDNNDILTYFPNYGKAMDYFVRECFKKKNGVSSFNDFDD